MLICLIAKGTGGGDLRAVGLGFKVDGEGIVADGGGKVDFVGDAIAVAGVDTDELVAFANLNRTEDADVLDRKSVV